MIQVSHNLFLSVCPAGKWGKDCEGQCECGPNAECDPINGRCYCTPGHKGGSCEAGESGYDSHNRCIFANSILFQVVFRANSVLTAVRNANVRMEPIVIPQMAIVLAKLATLVPDVKKV